MKFLAHRVPQSLTVISLSTPIIIVLAEKPTQEILSSLSPEGRLARLINPL